MPRRAQQHSQSTREFVCGLLSKLHAAYATQVEAVRADAALPEAIHQLRVACRRLRTCLAIYGRYLPPVARKLRRRLRKLSGRLSPARDLDVMLKRLRLAGPKLRATVDYLSARRAVQAGHVQDTMRKRGVDRITRDLDRLTHSRRDWPRQAEQPIAATAPRIVKRAWGEFAEACDAADETRSLACWHEVRIHGKRLRYTLDGLKHLLGDEAEPALQVLIELQDELGTYLDSRVALEQLKDLQDFAGIGDEAGHAIEAVMNSLRSEGKAALAAVPGLLQQVRDWGPELAARKPGRGKR